MLNNWSILQQQSAEFGSNIVGNLFDWMSHSFRYWDNHKAGHFHIHFYNLTALTTFMREAHLTLCGQLIPSAVGTVKVNILCVRHWFLSFSITPSLRLIYVKLLLGKEQLIIWQMRK